LIFFRVSYLLSLASPLPALTLTLSQRGRGFGSLSLWERVKGERGDCLN